MLLLTSLQFISLIRLFTSLVGFVLVVPIVLVVLVVAAIIHSYSGVIVNSDVRSHTVSELICV